MKKAPEKTPSAKADLEQKTDQRCDCGKLLFKQTKRGIEFKCNRCKRIHLIPYDRMDSEYRSLCPVIIVVDSEETN